MDYDESKYKEALKRARDVYTYYCDDREQLRKIESIFPELKESDSERIRKAIIEIVHDTPDCEEDYNVSKEDMLTWLEKQKPIKNCLNL